MSPGISPSAAIDIEDLLRRKRFMEQTQLQQPQPTTQPQTQPATITPNFGQQPQQPQQPQFDPKIIENIQKNLPFGQPQIPPTADVEATGAAYAKEAGKGVVPGDYKRNKLLTAVVAPLTLGRILHDPAQGIENLNQLTRKGYLAAEQEHARNLEQTKTAYTAAETVFRNKLAAATEGIKGNNEFIQQQIHLMDLGIKTPLEIQRSALELARLNLEINKLKAGEVMTGEPWHLMVDGKQTIGFPHKMADGTMGWVDGGSGKPIEGTVKPVGKVTEGQMSPVNQLIQKRLGDLGHPPTIEEYRKAVVDSETDIATPVEQRAEAAAKRAEQRAETRVTEARMTAAQASARTSARKVMDAQNTQITNLMGLNRTLMLAVDPKNANQVAQVLAPIELDTTLASPGARLSRYNSKAISDFRAATGKPNEWWAKFKNYIGKGSVVPDEMLAQIRPVIDAQIKTFQEERAIERDYINAVNNAKNETDLAKAQEKHDEALQNLYTTESTPPPPPPKIPPEKAQALKNLSDDELKKQIKAKQAK